MHWYSIDVDYIDERSQLAATAAAVETHKKEEQYVLEELSDEDNITNSRDAQLDLRLSCSDM